MDKLGTALGTGLNWLGSNVPQFLGGPQANWGTPFMPADTSAIATGLGSSSDPTLSSYFGGGAPSYPTGYTSTGAPGDVGAPMTSDPALALPYATAINPVGGNPAMATENAFSAIGSATDPMTNLPLDQAMGSSPTPGVLASLFPSLFGAGGGGGAGGAGTGGAGARSPWPGALSLLAGGGIDIAKFLQQRSLLDQSSLQKAEQNALKGQKAALERNVFPGVKAQLQETGNINAPYLETQAYTAAIAPYVQSQEQAAMENWLRANALAEGLYPTDLGNPLGGFVSPNIFGGGTA